MVLVDDQQRPLTIWPEHRISSHQHMTMCVLYIAGGAEELVWRVSRFDPFLGEELRGEILRSAPKDFVVFIHHEHVISAPAVRAVRVRRGIGQIVVIKSAFSSRSQKATKRIG